MSRIKPSDAMKYLGLKRDSFRNWCDAVRIKAYKYEYSHRTYFISGEFYAKADYNRIMKIKEIHGDKWQTFYPMADEVLAFLPIHQQKNEVQADYQPKTKEVLDFKKKLNEES